MLSEGLLNNAELFRQLKNGGQGTALGVFSSGIYLDFAGKTLLIHDAGYGFLPFGIAVNDFEGKANSHGIKAGESFCLTGLRLRFKGSDFSLKLDYKEPEQHTGCKLKLFAENAEKLLNATGRSAFSVFAPCKPECIDKSAVEDIFARAACMGISELTSAMDSNDTSAMHDALIKLIGLGRGLTPSMDDFLCGALYVFHYGANYLDRKIACLENLSCIVKSLAAERTNLYSAAYLISAAMAEDFSLMRLCLESSTGESFDCSALKLIGVGGSSGADMLSGMCFAANYILKQR